MKSCWLALLAGAVGFVGPAAAQQLPPPAAPPAPDRAFPTPTPVRPTPAPAQRTEPPIWAPAPPPTEEPIIIGEPPVRASAGVAANPKPAAKPAVAGVAIAGLTDAQAVKKLTGSLSGQLNSPIRLIVGEYQYTYQRNEVGAEIPYWPLMRSARTRGGNVPLQIKVNDTAALKAMRELDSQVREDFGNLGLNVGGSVARIKAALEATPPRESVQLLTVAVQEKPEPEKVVVAAPRSGAPSAAHPYLLTEFSTRYDASLRGRTTNLRIAARNINGTIVKNGAVFSTNASIGPRDAANGWKEAMMFVSGRVVSGVGSGICQCASTLYNAALLADLPIVERHAHSMRVTYVPPSRDAALLWNAKDFKFRNNTGADIYVQTYVEKGKFHAKLWSSRPQAPKGITLTTKVVNKGSTGTRSEAYKVVNGKAIRLSSDFYKPHP